MVSNNIPNLDNKILSEVYTRKNGFIYVYNKKLSEANAEKFKILNSFIRKDKNFYYVAEDDRCTMSKFLHDDPLLEKLNLL